MSGKGDYSVGFGKPPSETRFKPGHSGNRKGRPRGNKNRKAILREVMEETLVVTENNRRVRRTTLELLLLTLRNLALQGNLQACDMYQKYLDRYAPEQTQSSGGYIVVPAEMSPEEWVARQLEKNKTLGTPPSMEDYLKTGRFAE